MGGGASEHLEGPPTTGGAVICSDLGTANCKAVLLDAEGHVRAKVSEGYALQILHPGWTEQNARLVWAAAQKVLRAVAQDAPVPLQGICMSGAMHSLFPVASKAGTPISNAMTWADARATAVYRGLIADTDTPALYRRTGCPVHSTILTQEPTSSADNSTVNIGLYAEGWWQWGKLWNI